MRFLPETGNRRPELRHMQVSMRTFLTSGTMTRAVSLTDWGQPKCKTASRVKFFGRPMAVGYRLMNRVVQNLS